MKKSKQDKANVQTEGKVKMPKESRADRYRRKQRSTSIYFLVWAIFTTLSLLIVLFCGLAQQFTVIRAYKDQAAHDINEKGRLIEEQMQHGAPDWAGGNYSGFLRFLARSHDVDIALLDENGAVLFPQEPHFDPSAPEIEGHLNLSEELAIAVKKMQEQDSETVVYEGEEEFVYASKMEYAEGVEFYLYVTKSTELIESASASMGIRTTLLLAFAFILSFAVSSAVSSWLTKPITEFTEKSRRLAEGDFGVNFRGAEYGRELVELAEALNFAKDELSKTDRMQKELIANVSHDFKTPLTMIKAYASMIIEISGENREKRTKHAQVIVDEADRLASLVNDVLDLSKLSSGVESLQMDVFDLSAYTYEILDRFAYLKDTQGYRFETEIEDELLTRGDELKLGQVLYNLIGNAVNYTGEDHTVYVRLKRESESVCLFSVTDTGKGIKPEEINGIWERYYRSKEMHKRPVQGTGLGLSIVKTILQRHGLEFGVDSKVGEGSTFYVRFPLVSEKNAENPQKTE